MYRNSDFIAGAFVIGAFVLMLWATIVLGGHEGAFLEIFTGKENRVIKIEFENIAGLEVNQEVKVQGHKYGKVIKITPDKTGILFVEIELMERINIYEGYTIDIKDESVLGGKAIYINVGNKDALQIENLYMDNAPILKGRAAENIMAMGGDILEENREDIRAIIKNVKEISDKIKSLSTKANEGNGVVGRLLNDEELANNLKSSVANLNSIISRVKNGEGFLGKMINEDGLYKDVQKLIKDAQAALEDLREQAPITTFAGTLMGAF